MSWLCARASPYISDSRSGATSDSDGECDLMKDGQSSMAESGRLVLKTHRREMWLSAASMGLAATAHLVAAWFLVSSDWLGMTDAALSVSPAIDWSVVVRLAGAFVVVHIILRLIDAGWVFQDRRDRQQALAATQDAIAELRRSIAKRDA